ncbi:TolC family protein [Desulfomarina sp.]
MRTVKIIWGVAFILLICSATLNATEKLQSDYGFVVNTSEQGIANYETFRTKLFQRYSTLVDQMQQMEENYSSIFSRKSATGLVIDPGVIPKEYSSWWRSKVNGPINKAVPDISMDITSLFARALKYSSQIKVFSDLPLIRKTAIQEAEGPYDFRIFAETSLRDINEPVGDDLKTGGELRYKESSKNLEYGVRKKFLLGTEVELKQNIGDMDTNSTYFQPKDQARTGTYLTITQPLLKRFGLSYNRSFIDLATLDSSIAGEELRRNVESHLLEVSRAYWSLYLERSLLVQKERLAGKSQEIYEQMKSRTAVDVPPSLLARARSQVNAHELGAMQAEYAMLNAQSRIRALVNDPGLLNVNGLEIVTSQLPAHDLFKIDFHNALEAALSSRPEVSQAIRHIQSAYLRLNQSENELWPDLDLFFQVYTKGIEGDYHYGDAYSNQFDEGEPSYIAGLRLQYPLGNNSAAARNTRKKLEIRQLLHQLDTTVQNILLEVQVSHRELEKNYRSMVQSYQMMLADDEEVRALYARVDYLLANNDPYGDVLYRLMDASERLTRSEELFTKSELTYNYSLYNLYRAMGVLVKKNDIRIEEKDADSDGLPLVLVKKH